MLIYQERRYLKGRGMKPDIRSFITGIDWGMLFSLGIAVAALTLAILLIN